MQSANEEPVEFFHARINRGRRWFFVDWPAALLLGAPKVLRGRRLRRPAAKHVRLERVERRRVRRVVEFVRIRADVLSHPVLEEGFLFELGQFWFLTGASLRTRLRIIGGDRRIFPAKQNSLIRGLGIVETAAHFHFDFVNERFIVANSFFHFAKLAEQRAKFPGSPSDEARLVLALKSIPRRFQFREPRHRRGAFRRRISPDRNVIDQDEIPRDAILLFSLSRHQGD